MSTKCKIIMGVVIAVLVIAVIAVIIATNVDSGRSIDSSDFKLYTQNYSAAKKRTNEDGDVEVVVNGEGSERYVRMDGNNNGSYSDPEDYTKPAGQVI